MIGHFAVSNENKVVCRCGNTGCLQTIAGAEVIVQAARRGAQEGRSRLLAETLATSDEITPADIGVAAQRGDAFSAELLARCGRLIGGALSALTNAFNPSLIVISGSLAQTSDILVSAIREAVYRHSHPLVTRDLRIVRSQMGASSALTGAAMVVVDNLFATAPLSFWVAHGSPLRHPDMASQIASARNTLSARGPRPRPPDTASTPPAHPKP
jgi:predicted NBD/HSP70 family sugar kinase